MLTEICAHLHNWFVVPNGIRPGTYEISNGAFVAPLDFLQSGQYYYINGSVFNDGVHKFSDLFDGELKSETFTGEIWAMAVPKLFLTLVDEITAWVAKHPPSPYQSESFGGYSYNRGNNPMSGSPLIWKDIYRSNLNPWRKV